MTRMPFRMFFGLTALALGAAALPAVGAEELPKGTSNVTIEQQENKELGAAGTWTLLAPDQTSIKMSTANFTVKNLAAGRYMFFMQQPKGASTTITVFRGETTVATSDHPQLPVEVLENDNIRIHVRFTLSLAGEVVISSHPGGIPFTLRGPNSIAIDGITPMHLPHSPMGQYTVQYHPPGCHEPAPRSQSLRKDGRIDFSIEIVCATLQVGEEVKENAADRFITTTVDGAQVNFEDVPQSAWFAPYVFTMLRTGIMTGYKDDDGSPTGRFGPDNQVTLGELAKLAHRLAGLGEEDFSDPPRNVSARSEWFAPFVAAAEGRDWVVYLDPSVNLLRPARRGEILVTFLQALDIPVRWPRGELFTDVKRRTPYAGAIETAAADKIVSGFTDETGKATGLFGPDKPVTRGEVSKMMTKMMETYKTGASTSSVGQ